MFDYWFNIKREWGQFKQKNLLNPNSSEPDMPRSCSLGSVTDMQIFKFVHMSRLWPNTNLDLKSEPKLANKFLKFNNSPKNANMAPTKAQNYNNAHSLTKNSDNLAKMLPKQHKLYMTIGFSGLLPDYQQELLSHIMFIGHFSVLYALNLCAWQYCTVQFSSVQCSAVQCSAVQ